jgi:AraC-like DNA-binding protein
MERRSALMAEALRHVPWPALDTFDRAWRSLLARGGMPSVAELSEALHLSPRTLERAFRERLGLAPRVVRRLLRFQQALAAMRAEPARSLAEIAIASGYADHAHLTREFRALMGRAPSEFRAQG